MDVKKLKEISSQLKKASAMHKAQAGKIDRLLKSMKKPKKKMGKSLNRRGKYSHCTRAQKKGKNKPAKKR